MVRKGGKQGERRRRRTERLEAVRCGMEAKIKGHDRIRGNILAMRSGKIRRAGEDGLRVSSSATGTGVCQDGECLRKEKIIISRGAEATARSKAANGDTGICTHKAGHA